MKKLTEIKKKLASNWFKLLQERIVDQFQLIENEVNKKNRKRPKYFIKRQWGKKNKTEGGGTSYLLTGGEIFDKVGVNLSAVSGKFEKIFRSKILGAEENIKITTQNDFSSDAYEKSSYSSNSF